MDSGVWALEADTADLPIPVADQSWTLVEWRLPVQSEDAENLPPILLLKVSDGNDVSWGDWMFVKRLTETGEAEYVKDSPCMVRPESNVRLVAKLILFLGEDMDSVSIRLPVRLVEAPTE